MAFTAVKPVATAGKAVSGIRFGVKVSARNKKRQAILSMNAAAIAKAFGDIDIAAMRFTVAAGRGQDHGLIEVTAAENGSCKAANLIGGAIMFQLEPWDILPDGEHPSNECTIYAQSEGKVILRLPAWAQARQKAANGVTLP